MNVLFGIADISSTSCGADIGRMWALFSTSIIIHFLKTYCACPISFTILPTMIFLFQSFKNLQRKHTHRLFLSFLYFLGRFLKGQQHKILQIFLLTFASLNSFQYILNRFQLSPSVHLDPFSTNSIGSNFPL